VLKLESKKQQRSEKAQPFSVVVVVHSVLWIFILEEKLKVGWVRLLGYVVICC